ncbi:MAG: GNAT family N-acetyltransferase [Thiohalocapsa sp.]|jgi:predicted N-acetyltransferase YhbS
MEFLTDHKGREAEIIDLFTATFTASESEEEGALIGKLVRNLLCDTAEKNLLVFTAEQDGKIIGGIICSRLTFEHDEQTVFIVAPVAVAPHQQRKGTGQRLLNRGLTALRSAGVDIPMTYADPSYTRRAWVFG